MLAVFLFSLDQLILATVSFSLSSSVPSFAVFSEADLFRVSCPFQTGHPSQFVASLYLRGSTFADSHFLVFPISQSSPSSTLSPVWPGSRT